MTSADETSEKLINQTIDIRDDLLAATVKLESYVDALKEEIARLKRLAAAEDRQQRKG